MIGRILSALHQAFYAFTRSIADACDPGETQADAYTEMQARFDRERDAARAAHGRVNDVEARRREWLHGALRRSSHV